MMLPVASRQRDIINRLAESARTFTDLAGQYRAAGGGWSMMNAADCRTSAAQLQDLAALFTRPTRALTVQDYIIADCYIIGAARLIDRIESANGKRTP